MKTRVKVCCIQNMDEAKLAIEYGASALGLVANMPSGPGVIEDTMIFDIARQVPPPIATFLLTSETRAQDIILHQQKVQTNTVQMVDALSEGNYQDIKNVLPSIKLVQVIHVLDEKSVEEAILVSKHVDALLLDSGNPHLKTKELGGTGRTHNWELSRNIRDSVQIPLFLAGGLNPDNIQEAIEVVQPFGVDICSGVRTNGNLDERKLNAFFEAIKKIDN